MAHLFTPVPIRARRDGWTPDRQHAFIAALARLGSPAHAARSVGMSVRTAWRLRDRDDLGEFRMAWDAAVDQGQQAARDHAIARATDGVEMPVIRRGCIVGYELRYDNRLLLAALRSHSAPPLFERRRGALAGPVESARQELGWEMNLLREQQAILAREQAAFERQKAGVAADDTIFQDDDINWDDYR